MTFNEFCKQYSISKEEKKQLKKWLGIKRFARLTEREWLELWEQFHDDN